MTRSGTLAPLLRDSPAAARAAELRYVSDEEPGIRRIRRGRGFVYRTPNDKPLTDEKQLRRIASLAIPPAWTNVWICPSADGHIQATGRDARGRKQYRYHARWRERPRPSEVPRRPPLRRAIAQAPAPARARSREPAPEQVEGDRDRASLDGADLHSRW